jgi:hypothetical protein
VAVTQDLHLKAGSPLDSGLKSILSYYDEPDCPTVLYVPSVSLYRMDSSAVKPVDLPLFLSASADWKLKFGLPLTAYTLKDSYDSQVPDLKTFDTLATQSNQIANSDAVKSQFPGAMALTIKDGATDPEAVKQLRREIGAELCKGKQVFGVILAPNPEVVTPPPAPAPKPTPLINTTVSSTGPVAKATTHPAKATTQPVKTTPPAIRATPPPVKAVVSARPSIPPAVQMIKVPTPAPSAPPKPPPAPNVPAVKPCYTVQVFSIYKERPEDNPIQDGSSFAIDDPDKGLLTKGNLTARAKPCAPVPPRTEVRLKWTKDGIDQANLLLAPNEADGTMARSLQNHPLPGQYEVRAFVGGVEATPVGHPFRFTILAHGSSGAVRETESSGAKESK